MRKPTLYLFTYIILVHLLDKRQLHVCSKVTGTGSTMSQPAWIGYALATAGSVVVSEVPGTA